MSARCSGTPPPREARTVPRRSYPCTPGNPGTPCKFPPVAPVQCAPPRAGQQPPPQLAGPGNRIRAALAFADAEDRTAQLIHPGPSGDEADRYASLADTERAQSLRLLGPGHDVNHDGQVRTVVHPRDEAVNAVGGSFEDRFNPAVGKVAHPPVHAVLEGPSPAGVAEVHALDPAGGEHPIADHKQTLRRERVARHRPARTRGAPGRASISVDDGLGVNLY